MKYAKLINGYPVYAPNPIVVDGIRIGNPPGEVYLAEGYKLVQFSDQPEPLGIGWWEELWTEDNLNIYNTWQWNEATDDDEISPEEALGVVTGGDGS